jgi:hypothetical protein
VLWLELEVGRSERGHREIKLNDEPLRTDAAILPSLVTMECRSVNWYESHKSKLSDLVFRAFLGDGSDREVSFQRVVSR